MDVLMGWLVFAGYIVCVGAGIILLAWGEDGKETKHIVYRVIGVFLIAVSVVVALCSMGTRY